MEPRRHVAFAVGALFFTLLACKTSYTPPGTHVDAAAEAAPLDESASGECEPKTGNRKCLAGGKAAYCKTLYIHNPPSRLTTIKGEWVTVTCPDCVDTGSFGLRCSEFTAGEPCDTFKLQTMCTGDKLAMYVCDSTTNVWSVEQCRRGCTDAPPSPPLCRH